MQKEWVTYKVGRPSQYAGGFNEDCKPLETVSHVAHVSTAVRILEDRQIFAGLVYDESKLNTHRIRVAWLSPNDWVRGFRYGNVRFSFDWASIVSKKRAYWVEAITKYKPPACRILLSDADHGSEDLREYDPTTGDGPWWSDADGRHYWKGDICLEVMIEQDVFLSGQTTVDFVKHHSEFCSVDSTRCPHMGEEACQAGAQFVSTCVARGLSLRYPGLIEELDGKLSPTLCLRGAFDCIIKDLSTVGAAYNGTLTSGDAGSKPLARAVLGALSSSKLRPECSHLVSLFRSESDLKESIAKALAKSAGLPGGAIFLEKLADPLNL